MQAILKFIFESQLLASMMVYESHPAITFSIVGIHLRICLQKGESGLHMGASCFWEAKHDGNFNKKYDFEDFYIVSNFFGITRN